MAQAIVFSALEAQFKGNAKPFLKSARTVSLGADRLASQFRRLAVIIGGAFAAYKMYAFGKASLKLYAEQEAAEKALAKALKTHKQFSDALFKSLKKRASVMQEQLGIGDEVILQMEATATSLGVERDMLEDVIRTSLDFSRGIGIDAKSALLTLSKALAGNVTMLQRYGIQVEAGASKMEILRAVQERFAGQQKAWADSTAGKMARIINAWGDFKEMIGKALTEFATKFHVFEGLRTAIGWIQDLTTLFSNSTITWEQKWKLFEAYVASVWTSIQLNFEIMMIEIGANEWWEKIKKKYGAWVDSAKKAAGNITRIWGIFKATVVGTWTDIVDGAKAAWDFLSRKFGNLIDALGLRPQFEKIKKFWLEAWESPKGVFGALRVGIEDLIKWMERLGAKLGIVPEKIKRISEGQLAAVGPKWEPIAQQTVADWLKAPKQAPSPEAFYKQLTVNVNLPEVDKQALAQAIIAELTRQGYTGFTTFGQYTGFEAVYAGAQGE